MPLVIASARGARGDPTTRYAPLWENKVTRATWARLSGPTGELANADESSS
jgi:hypothetical protein